MQAVALKVSTDDDSAKGNARVKQIVQYSPHTIAI
jgi:hypothetical protein